MIASRALALIAVFLTFCSCRHDPSKKNEHVGASPQVDVIEMIVQPLEIVSKVGNFRLVDSDVQLDVFVVPTTGVLGCKLYSAEDCVAPIENFSPYQNWFACWDVDSRLWFWSSDVGGSICSQSEQGKFTNHTIGGTDIQSMPQNFRDKLPQSVLRYLERE